MHASVKGPDVNSDVEVEGLHRSRGSIPPSGSIPDDPLGDTHQVEDLPEGSRPENWDYYVQKHKENDNTYPSQRRSRTTDYVEFTHLKHWSLDGSQPLRSQRLNQHHRTTWQSPRSKDCIGICPRATSLPATNEGPPKCSPSSILNVYTDQSAGDRKRP